MFLALCVLLQSASADTNGLSLTLHFPYTEMLVDEWFDYSITLSNQSDSAILIIEDPRSMIPCQMIFDLGTKKEYCNSHYSFDDSWGKWKAFRGSRKNAVPLPPGESYTWEVFYGYSDLRGAIERFGVTNMSVRCLLGTNQWVRSNTVSLKFYQEEAKEPSIGSLRIVRLGTKRHVFNFLNQRICEIPEDDEPIIHHDADADMVTVSFAKSRRKIIYDPRRAKVIQEQHDKCDD
jgi:hypothetical protein